MIIYPDSEPGVLFQFPELGSWNMAACFSRVLEGQEPLYAYDRRLAPTTFFHLDPIAASVGEALSGAALRREGRGRACAISSRYEHRGPLVTHSRTNIGSGGTIQTRRRASGATVPS